MFCLDLDRKDLTMQGSGFSIYSDSIKKIKTWWGVRSDVMDETSSVEKLKDLGVVTFYYLNKVSVYQPQKYEEETIGIDR